MAECLRCPFCENATLESSTEVARVPAIVREHAAESFTVWRCASCRSLHSKEDVDLDAYYRIYPFANHKLDFWTRVSFQNRLRQLTREGLTRAHSILEFGCGAGLFVEYLKSQGYTATVGYDAYVPQHADRAVLERRYAAVLAQDVIEHAEDPEAMLQDLVACLEPGGLLYLGTPLADAIRLPRHADYAMSLHQPYHRHILSRQALLAITGKRGLTPVRLTDRHCTDTRVPSANTRFLHEFIRASGNVVNAAFEPPAPGVLRRNPRLLVHAFLGYFTSRRCEMSSFFRKA